MRSTLIRLCAVALAAAVAIPARAEYPERLIRFVLPYAPGGIIDFVGRTLAQRLSETMGQPVVAENKPGAGGILGTDFVARSAPDGYTILLMDPAIVINPTLMPGEVHYDIFKDLQSISMVSSSPVVVVVTPKLGVRTFQELTAYGKAHPGVLNFASAGIGTAPHLAGEMWKLATGVQATHIPYKGIGASFTDLMNGNVQIAFSSIAGALPFTEDNRIIALATTGRTRSNVYPNLPTVAEAGIPGYEVDLWVGVFGPAGMPPQVLARLNGELRKALNHPETKANLTKVGAEPHATAPAEGTAFLRAEHGKWAKVIADGKLRETN